jgi:uncharacterized RDD family membrane protein YckC
MSVQVEEQPVSPVSVHSEQRVAARVAPRAAELNFERLRAPFSLRCGALLIDYIVLITILAVGTILTRTFGEGRRGDLTYLFVSYAVIAFVAVLNLVLLPAWSGRSIGKWVTGLHIECRDGMPLSIGRTLLRHLVGYPLTCLTLGAGFLLAVFGSEGRALHDFLAGTVVVRSRPKL